MVVTADDRARVINAENAASAAIIRAEEDLRRLRRQQSPSADAVVRSLDQLRRTYRQVCAAADIADLRIQEAVTGAIPADRQRRREGHEVQLRRARGQSTRTGRPPPSSQAHGRVRGRSPSPARPAKRLNTGAQGASAVLLSTGGGESASTLAPQPGRPDPLDPRSYDTRLNASPHPTRESNEEVAGAGYIQWFASSDSESETKGSSDDW
jgi:hypothetical protein